jgi:hypothetical protein
MRVGQKWVNMGFYGKQWKMMFSTVRSLRSREAVKVAAKRPELPEKRLGWDGLEARRWFGNIRSGPFPNSASAVAAGLLGSAGTVPELEA